MWSRIPTPSRALAYPVRYSEGHLEAALEAGERGMQRWLAGERWVPVPCPPGPLRNINRREDLDPSVFFPAAPGS